ncbi:MAG: hypothetical protein MK137_01110 [Rickettsiales bacterium]|nr:hypothetical protein [Rickettsiales bacterium]
MSLQAIKPNEISFSYPVINGIAGKHTYYDLIFNKDFFPNGDRITNKVIDYFPQSNFVFGTEENDWVNSRGKGNDTINGGDGRDILTKSGANSGIGTFTFSNSFHSTKQDPDLIIGFDANDVLDLSNVGIRSMDQLDIQKYTVVYYGDVQNVLTEVTSKVNNFAVNIMNNDTFGSIKFAGSNQLVDFNNTIIQSNTNIIDEDGTFINVVQGSDLTDRIFSGSGNDQLYGNGSDDLLNGNQGQDSVFGGSGNDSVFGGQDNDFVQGNQGFDFVNGNLGNDTVLGGRDNDTIRGGQHEDFVNGNRGDDLVFGDKGHDTVRGGSGNDQIYGGENNDALFGDRGNDTLTGGSGEDGFYFLGQSGTDVITDFEQGTDKLYISSQVYSSMDEVIANFENGTLNFDGGSDNVELVGISSLNAGDIVIF